MKLLKLILVGLGVAVLQTCPSIQAARAISATVSCSFRFHPHFHGVMRQDRAFGGGPLLVGSSALCVATYTAEVNLGADLGGLQGRTMTAEHDAESLVIDVATEQKDVQTADRDSLLATFETAAQAVCHGTQTTRNDADTVKGDLAVTEDDLATFRADARVVASRIPRLSVDAATLRHDIASAHYTPAGATRDLAATAPAIETARSALALARSLVAGDVQTAPAASTQANAYAAAAQSACNQLRR